MSEIVALTVLLIHYWRAGLRSYAKEKRDSARSSGSASASSRPGSNSGRGASGSASIDEGASAKDAEAPAGSDMDDGIVEL